MQITVPFCYLPNSKSQTFDMETCRRSEFQIQKLLEISQRPTFAYFVTQGFIGGIEGKKNLIYPEYPDPFLMSWYNRDGSSEAMKIGRVGILWENITHEGKPLPLDHVVYTSRCEQL